jgi:hypothetical protein
MAFIDEVSGSTIDYLASYAVEPGLQRLDTGFNQRGSGLVSYSPCWVRAITDGRDYERKQVELEYVKLPILCR